MDIVLIGDVDNSDIFRLHISLDCWRAWCSGAFCFLIFQKSGCIGVGPDIRPILIDFPFFSVY